MIICHISPSFYIEIVVAPCAQALQCWFFFWRGGGGEGGWVQFVAPSIQTSVTFSNFVELSIINFRYFARYDSSKLDHFTNRSFLSCFEPHHESEASTSTLLGVCINLHVQFLGAAGSKAFLGGPGRQKERIKKTVVL